MVDVLVEYDYVAKEHDELTIKKGDIIKDVVKKQGGWWEGVLNDKKGLFPDNFVKVINKDSDVLLRNKLDVNRIRQCRVVFSYNQDHEDELNLKVGDIINITGEEEEGWWKGILNGKEGVFPSNFVEEIKVINKTKNNLDGQSDIIESETDKHVPTLPSKSAKEVCVVRYSYKAQNEDELTLKEGDKVVILSKTLEDPGWWRGELNGKIGVFPDNFVEVVNDSKKNNQSQKNSAARPTSVASQRKSLETKNADINKTPPVPSKKPLISLKKSPSGSGANLLSDLKKKIADVVDGATNSKSPKIETTSEPKDDAGNEAFDQVERKPLLVDVRATRAKAPGRRPPSIVLKPNEPFPNGNEISENLSIKPEEETAEVRPKVREWEKHKAPWLNEMKQHQAKRTSLSPGPDSKPKIISSPIEKEIGPEEVKKDISNDKDISTSTESEPSVGNLSSKTHSEVDHEKPPSVKTKPIVPITNKYSSNVQNNLKEISPSKFRPNSVPSPMATHPSEKTVTDNNEIVTYKQYMELVERIDKLEKVIEKQHVTYGQAIEELKNKLQIETEMRMLLQEQMQKISLKTLQS